MQINLFNGGLSTRLLPHLIQANEAVKCENVDTSKGALVPLKAHKDLNTQAARSIYKFKGNWIMADEDRDYAEFQETLYYSNGLGKPQWSKDGLVFYNLGIDRPSSDSTSASFTEGNNQLNIKPLFGIITEAFSGIKKVEASTGKNFTADKLNIFRHFNGKIFEEGDTSNSDGVSGMFAWELGLEGLDPSDCLQLYFLSTEQNRYERVYFGGPVFQNPHPVAGTPRPPLYPPSNIFRDWEPTPTSSPLEGSDGWYVQTDNSKFISKRAAQESFITNEYVKSSSGSTWVPGDPDANFMYSEYLSYRTYNKRGFVGDNGGDQKKFPEITTPFGPKLGSEATFVVFTENKEVKAVTVTTLPSKYEATVDSSTGTYYAGFSFEWIYEDTDIVQLFIGGYFYGEYKLSDASERRVKVPYVLKEREGQRKVNDVLDSLESVKYVVTYENFNGEESQASDPLILPDVADSALTLPVIKVLKSPDPQVKYINIYRLGGNLTVYTRVARIPNEDTTFVDTLSDVEVEGTILASSTRMPAPDGLRYLTASNAMLFGALGDKLYFSNVADAYFWEPTNFIDFENTITGIGPTPNGLLVFTRNKTFIVTGNSPSTFSKYVLSAAVGCVLHKSIQTLTNTLVWLAENGLYASAGGSISPLSYDKLGEMYLLNPVCAEVLGDRYFLSYQSGTIILDLREGLAFTSLDDRFKALHANEGKIYACSADNRLLELFGSSESLAVDYITPEYSDGSISERKVYSVLYFFVEGEIEVEAFIDGKSAAKTKLVSGFNTLNIAQGSTRGFYLQFHFKGKGTVKEIEYIAEGRQNGR